MHYFLQFYLLFENKINVTLIFQVCYFIQQIFDYKLMPKFDSHFTIFIYNNSKISNFEIN